MTLTLEMIAQERIRLGNTINALDTAYNHLKALSQQDRDAGDEEGAAVVDGWIADLRDLANAIDQAYGETFHLRPDPEGGDAS